MIFYKTRFVFAMFAISLGLLRLVAGQQPQTMIFNHVNVIDGLSNAPLLDTTVVVTNGKIATVERLQKAPPHTPTTFDMQGKWLLPGYVDAHVHFADTERARTALRLGATTVRTMQCDHFLDIQIRDAHRHGREDLPDVVAAGYQIRPAMSPAFFEDFPQFAALRSRISGTENVRRVVRALVSRRVDQHQISCDGTQWKPRDQPSHSDVLG